MNPPGVSRNLTRGRNGVVDGRQVNIPVLGDIRLTNGVTEKDSDAICWIWWYKRVGGALRQIRVLIKH